MREQRLEGIYLVDNGFLLRVKEEQCGFRYHCFSKNDESQIYNGLIAWSDIEESPVCSALAAARIEAIHQIGLIGEKVSAVSTDRMENS